MRFVAAKAKVAPTKATSIPRGHGRSARTEIVEKGLGAT